ncbi:MAG: GTP cyclohydrolase I FolE [Deltaproteobacteria bacterium]|nr:GTP cyclohydrolase I FolE [Deltaproteobacteria bacterium]
MNTTKEQEELKTNEQKVQELKKLITKNVSEILVACNALGVTDEEALANTPRRVAKAFVDEFLCGYTENPEEILRPVFEAKYDELVIVKNIEFWSLCQHHLLPFYGEAFIGYIPTGKVVGLSKLARLVHCFSRRLQLQETLTQQIADAIQETLQPLGAGVIIEATHSCMSARGVKASGAKTVTSVLTGVLRDNTNQARREFLSLIRE